MEEMEIYVSCDSSQIPDSDTHVIPRKYISQDEGNCGELENKCPVTYVPSKGRSFYLTTVVFFPRAVLEALCYQIFWYISKETKMKILDF